MTPLVNLSSFASSSQSEIAYSDCSSLSLPLSSPSPSPSPSVASEALDYEAWVKWVRTIDEAQPLSYSSSIKPASSSDSTAPSGVSSERTSFSVDPVEQNRTVSSYARSASSLVGRSFYLEPESGQTSTMQLIPVGVHSGQPSGVLSNSSDDPAISFKLSSSSSSGASSAVSSSETGGAGAQKIPKIKHKKKINKINRLFPEPKYFHPFFSILYPAGSEIKYLKEKGKLVQGVIEEIWIGPSGVPLVRIENQWVEFKHLFAPDLKRNNNAMVFTKGFSKHVAAEVTGFVLKNTDAGLMRIYNMRTSSLDSIEFRVRLDNTNENQLYRVIPFIKNRAAKVQAALKKVWSEFNHINEDD